MSKLGKNVVSQHMSWTFLPPFYCAWFSITENDIRLIRKLWFIMFNNYPGLHEFIFLFKVVKSVMIWSGCYFIGQQLSNGWLSLIYNLAFRGFIHILTIAGLFGNLENIIHILLEKQEWDCMFLKIWEPKHGRCSRGRPATTFIDQQTGMGEISVRVHLKLIYYRSIHYREYNYSYS